MLCIVGHMSPSFVNIFIVTELPMLLDLLPMTLNNFHNNLIFAAPLHCITTIHNCRRLYNISPRRMEG